MVFPTRADFRVEGLLIELQLPLFRFRHRSSSSRKCKLPEVFMRPPRRDLVWPREISDSTEWQSTPRSQKSNGRELQAQPSASSSALHDQVTTTYLSLKFYSHPVSIYTCIQDILRVLTFHHHIVPRGRCHSQECRPRFKAGCANTAVLLPKMTHPIPTTRWTLTLMKFDFCSSTLFQMPRNKSYTRWNKNR